MDHPRLPESAKLYVVEDVALFGHLAGVLAFVAGIVLAGVAFESARRRRRPAEIALLLGLTRIGAILVMAGALLLLACGLWLVGLEDVGYGTGWVDTAIVLFLVTIVVGALAGRRPKRARKLASRLAAEDRDANRELHALLGDPASRLANYASAILVVAILALMVFKP